MGATASITIVVDDLEATQAFRNIDAASKQTLGTMTTGARNAKDALDSVTPALGRIGASNREGREAAVLLTEELGVRMPRALANVLSDTQGIGPALQAAFSTVAIGAFIGLAVQLGDTLAKFIDKQMGWTEGAKKKMAVQVEMNKATEKANADIARLLEQYELIGLTGLPRISKEQQIANDKFAAANKTVSDLTEQLAKLQKQSQEMTSGSTPYQIANLPSDALQLPALSAGAREAKGQIDGVTQRLHDAREEVRTLEQATKNVNTEFSTTFSKDHEEAIKKIATATQEASAKLLEMADAANKAGLTGIDKINADAAAQINAVEKIYSKYPALAAQAAAAELAIQDDASRKRLKLLTDEADKKLKLFDTEEDQELTDEQAALKKKEEDEQRHAEKLRRMEDETINAEHAAAIASAPPWERANARIVADYQERMDKIKEMVATGDLDEQHATRMQTAALQDLYAQRVDALASQMQSLFDDITSGNIGKAFLRLFEQMIFRMVAMWIVGMGQMRSASQQQMGSGGGILGAIFGSLGLGGIFGGGGGSAQGGISGLPGVITNFMGGGGGASGGLVGSGDIGNLPLSIPGLGISAGMGGGQPGGVLPSGSSAGGALGGAGGLGGILAKIFPNGLKIGGMSISGSALATAGIGLLASNFMGGGILHGLGGALGGAMLGFSIFGPLGALIGGIGGFLSGIFSHSTKKARLAIEANIKAQSQAIEDGYNLFQIDWSGSRSQLEALRQQGVDALKQAGVKDISRSRVGHVDHWIDKAEKEIDATQAERNARSALTFGPAQFRVGGFVGPGTGGAAPAWFTAGAMHFSGGGAVPAILHEGEFVMRPEAVARWGVGTLHGMNSGSGGAGVVHNHYYISALDAKSVSQLFRRMQLEGSW